MRAGWRAQGGSAPGAGRSLARACRRGRGRRLDPGPPRAPGSGDRAGRRAQPQRARALGVQVIGVARRPAVGVVALTATVSVPQSSVQPDWAGARPTGPIAVRTDFLGPRDLTRTELLAARAEAAAPRADVSTR